MLKPALRVKVMALTLVPDCVETNGQGAKKLKDLMVSMAQARCFLKSFKAKPFVKFVNPNRVHSPWHLLSHEHSTIYGPSCTSEWLCFHSC